MTDWRQALGEEEREALEKEDHPEWLSPMLATLTSKRFSDPDWIYEPKFDGERALAFCQGKRLRLLSRNRKSLNDTYPELVDALREVEATDYVVDGEIVAAGDGPGSFARLQQRMQIKDPDKARASGVAVRFHLFDLPYFDGYRLDALPLRTRKSLLKRCLDFDTHLRYTPHRNTEGEAYFREACEQGLEGVIAKRADGPYRHSRSTDWLKFKCGKGQELVIGGFTEPKGERRGFGALLVGYYEGDRLRYAGKVGTGYDDEFLEQFRKRLDSIERDTSPFSDAVDEAGAHWVTPRFVAEFGFTEWTGEGKLRHPRFLGLRRDKKAREVVRETPED